MVTVVSRFISSPGFVSNQPRAHTKLLGLVCSVQCLEELSCPVRGTLHQETVLSAVPSIRGLSPPCNPPSDCSVVNSGLSPPQIMLPKFAADAGSEEPAGGGGALYVVRCMLSLAARVGAGCCGESRLRPVRTSVTTVSSGEWLLQVMC